MDDLAKQQERRIQLLRALYEATNGGPVIGASYLPLGAELGLSREETEAAMDHLTQVAGWAQRTTLSPTKPDACMTAAGVQTVERILQQEQPGDALRAWRRSCEAKSVADLQDGLDRNLYNRKKANIARSVIEEKREQQREQGEVATLKREIANLKGERRDKRIQLRVAWIAVLATLVVGFRSELAELGRGAWVVLQPMWSRLAG